MVQSSEVKPQDIFELQKAIYGEDVAFVYATNFQMILTDYEWILAIGVTEPSKKKDEKTMINKYSHRIHLPVKTAHDLLQHLQRMIQQRAQQQSQSSDARH